MKTLIPFFLIFSPLLSLNSLLSLSKISICILLFRLEKLSTKKMTRQDGVISDKKNIVLSTIFSNGVVQKPRKYYYDDIISSDVTSHISSWVDSMRASSPTRPSLSDDLTIPSALDMFEQILLASKGKQIVMFLDYDGTLSPIVDDPDRAFMSHTMRTTVRKLGGYFPTAIVSGRCRDKVYNFVKLAQLYYAGSHGMDIKGPAKGSKYSHESQAVLFQPATQFLPIIHEVYQLLLEKTKSIPGAKVEHNKFCLSVHFRCVDEKKWIELAYNVRSVLKDYPKLRLTQGRKVLEIRPSIEWDKGKALEFLLESLGLSNCSDVFPVYIGDDRSDEDAFKVLRDRGQGFGILVSKNAKETNASYYLREPLEVMDFLRRLVKWRQRSLRRQFSVYKNYY